MKRYILTVIAILVGFACGFVVGWKPWIHEEEREIPNIKIGETTCDEMIAWDPEAFTIYLGQGPSSLHTLSDGTVLAVTYQRHEGDDVETVAYYWVYPNGDPDNK